MGLRDQFRPKPQREPWEIKSQTDAAYQAPQVNNEITPPKQPVVLVKQKPKVEGPTMAMMLGILGMLVFFLLAGALILGAVAVGQMGSNYCEGGQGILHVEQKKTCFLPNVINLNSSWVVTCPC